MTQDFYVLGPATDYNSKHIDIDVGDTKTITKQKGTNYVYFPQDV